MSQSPRDVDVETRLIDYLGFHDEAPGGDAPARRDDFATKVNQYYDLVTKFYEFGWGQSFHFAPRRQTESLRESITRHAHFLAQVLGLRSGMHVLDAGCGVGGPMREIACFSGAKITGVNNNRYQVARAHRLNRKAQLQEICDVLHADFMAVPLPDAIFDAVYLIEAACHAPHRQALFREMFRLTKPGGSLGLYDWCLTPLYDPAHPDHRKIKKGIEKGNALPDIHTFDQVVDACTEVGYEIVEARDLALESDPETPWSQPLQGKGLTPAGIQRTRFGRKLSSLALRWLEAMKIAPKGSVAVSAMLHAAADALVAGGTRGIFTPMFFCHAKKP